MKKIFIAGGGTAGWLAASLLKSFLKDSVEITLVQNSTIGVVGVGESTTDIMRQWCRITNVDFLDLIKNIGTTIKMGIRFEEWNGPGHKFYHNFNESFDIPFGIKETNLVYAYELANNLNTGAETYSEELCESGKIPIWVNENDELVLDGTFSVHIDAFKFSRYIESLFKDRVTVIEGLITTVNTSEDGITSVLLEDGQEFTADLFIDASGLRKVLTTALPTEFKNEEGNLLNNAAWNCQIPYMPNEKVPGYTNARAHANGWTWTIPLNNRYGTGWVYSNKYQTKEEAKECFLKRLKERHNIDPDNVKLNHVEFTPGRLKEPWNKNLVSIGLSSGFLEPLEATNIHMTIGQIMGILRCWPGEIVDIKRKQYNSIMNDMWKQAIDIIRLHYITTRRDSEYWKYMTTEENIPSHLKEKVNHLKQHLVQPEDVWEDFDRNVGYRVFGLHSYGQLLKGLDLQTPDIAQRYLNFYNLNEKAKYWHNVVINAKKANALKYVDHTEFVRTFVKD